MSPIVSLLLCIAVGTIIMMAGILISRESEKSLSSTLTASLIWGIGFFVSMSMQVLAIARL